MPPIARNMPATLVRPPFEPTWALIRKPAGYSGSGRKPGKVESIWRTNSKSLYHRLSPYTDYDNTILRGFSKEPYYWIYPDEGGKGLSALRKYDSRLFPLGSAPIDVIRVSKFLGSGRGLPFLAKQFLLQTGSPYNERRIYNPTSPIIAAGMGLTLGAIRPERSIDTSGGLLGIANSIIGSAASLFGPTPINPPAGTAGLKALPDATKSTGGKGLIRAGTAETAKSHLEAAWIKPTPKGFGAIALGVVKSLFQNFLPQRQTGIEVRSDEGAYGLMVGGGDKKFSYIGASSTEYGWGQLWVAGASGVAGIRKKAEKPTTQYRIFVKVDKGVVKNVAETSQTGFLGNISGVGVVGYSIAESGDPNKPGYRYGDWMGVRKSGDYEASDIMYQYKYYADPKQEFPTKLTNEKTSRGNKNTSPNQNDNLKSVLENLRKVSGGTYVVNVPDNSRIISSGKSSEIGYDRLFKAKDRGSSPKQFLKEYRDKGIRMVSNELTTDVKNSLKLPTAGHFDAINTLEVLDKDKKIPSSKMRLKGWDKWEPYKDDLIALYFYDVVNEKYIPFRAAIKGLQEMGNASWEEMPFIGRGDKLYSYGGFNRNLSMNININIGSLVELAPTWQRINYLTTLVKPANYTTAKYAGAMNRFMVPPMVMLTIGDLYKDQPILIQSVTTTIPDDATWEVQHQLNGEQWQHLVDYIKAPANILFGQLPRTIDIALGLILLEKERAIVGGANFGHAPRGEEWERWNTTTVPDGGNPTDFHQSLVVDIPKTGTKYQ